MTSLILLLRGFVYECGNLGSGEKSALLFQYHYHSHIMDLEYLESNALICDLEGDWGLTTIALGVWFHMEYEY